MTCFQVWKIRTTAIGHSVRTFGECRARANGEFGICWDVGVGTGGGGADESLAGVGGFGDGARPADGWTLAISYRDSKDGAHRWL